MLTSAVFPIPTRTFMVAHVLSSWLVCGFSCGVLEVIPTTFSHGCKLFRWRIFICICYLPWYRCCQENCTVCILSWPVNFVRLFPKHPFLDWRLLLPTLHLGVVSKELIRVKYRLCRDNGADASSVSPSSFAVANFFDTKINFNSPPTQPRSFFWKPAFHSFADVTLSTIQ